MKKVIINGLIFIVFGFILGELFFGNIKDTLNKIKNTDTYYFLQEGVYSNMDALQNNLRNVTQKIIDKENNKYYVYVGITKDKTIANRIMDIYEKKGYKVHMKEKDISSPEFSENVNQFDLLIKDTDSEEQVLIIEQVVLANYEELTKKQ